MTQAVCPTCGATFELSSSQEIPLHRPPNTPPVITPFCKTGYREHVDVEED